MSDLDPQPGEDDVRELLVENARMEVALLLIATPRRADGSWNRDREACRLLAEEALNRD